MARERLTAVAWERPVRRRKPRTRRDEIFEGGLRQERGKLVVVGREWIERLRLTVQFSGCFTSELGVVHRRPYVVL
jgi:hypothetical protein